jgi:hypothetical protein
MPPRPSGTSERKGDVIGEGVADSECEWLTLSFQLHEVDHGSFAWDRDTTGNIDLVQMSIAPKTLAASFI